MADIAIKKRDLDTLRSTLRPGGLEGLDHSQRIDITYTSNAIEGNTLTAGETALVLEKGITVGGKPLKDHLEAIDHAKALDWVLQVASTDTMIVETDIRSLHHLVMASSAPEIAGQYATRGRHVNTSSGIYSFPPPSEVAALMRDFVDWLSGADIGPATAFEAHLRFVGIHPFNDGNGRTARLLMNLILGRAGYPPIAVRPEDRQEYLSALETHQSGGGDAAFNALLLRRLDKTLDIYLSAARQGQISEDANPIVPLRT